MLRTEPPRSLVIFMSNSDQSILPAHAESLSLLVLLQIDSQSQGQGSLHMMYRPEAGFVPRPQIGMGSDPQVPLVALQHSSNHLPPSNSSSLLMGSRPESSLQHFQQAECPPAAVDAADNVHAQSMPPASACSSRLLDSSAEPADDTVSHFVPSSAPQHLDETSTPAMLGAHAPAGSLSMDQLSSIPVFADHQIPPPMDMSQPFTLSPNEHSPDDAHPLYQAPPGPTKFIAGPPLQLDQSNGLP